jgi:hypothetical protein
MSSLTAGFYTLGLKQAQTFREHPDDYLECLVKFSSQRSILYTCYRFLKSSGIIQPLENLPIEFKRDIFDKAKEIAKGRLDRDKMVVLSACLYCLEFLLDNPLKA